MQNVSRVTGGPIQVRIKDRDILLKEMTFENLGAIQEEMLKQKRRRLVQSAVAAKEVLPPAEGKELLDRAIQEASNILSVTDEDATKYLSTQEGVCFFLWVVIDSQYPNLVSRSEVLELLMNETFGEQQIGQLTDRVFGNNGGNEIGQSNEAVAAP